LVKDDLPGLKKDDIHLELHDGYLTLKGERKSEREEKKENYCRTREHTEVFREASESLKG